MKTRHKKYSGVSIAPALMGAGFLAMGSLFNATSAQAALTALEKGIQLPAAKETTNVQLAQCKGKKCNGACAGKMKGNCGAAAACAGAKKTGCCGAKKGCCGAAAACAGAKKTGCCGAKPKK